MRSFFTSGARTATSMVSPDANAVGHVLRSSLQRRVDDLMLVPEAIILAARVCVRRFMRSFTPACGITPINVPHPSRRQWLKDPDNPRLFKLRQLFVKCP